MKKESFKLMKMEKILLVVTNIVAKNCGFYYVEIEDLFKKKHEQLIKQTNLVVKFYHHKFQGDKTLERNSRGDIYVLFIDDIKVAKKNELSEIIISYCEKNSHSPIFLESIEDLNPVTEKALT